MMKTLEEVTGNIRTGNSAITEDLERQEVERENLWKRLQAARAEGDQLRALAQRRRRRRRSGRRPSRVVIRGRWSS